MGYGKPRPLKPQTLGKCCDDAKITQRVGRGTQHRSVRACFIACATCGACVEFECWRYSDEDDKCKRGMAKASYEWNNRVSAFRTANRKKREAETNDHQAHKGNTDRCAEGAT